MNRVPVYRHRGLAHDLGEARVGVYGHAHLLRRPLDQLGEDALGDEIRDLRAYHVHPQNKVGLRIGDHLHEAVRLAFYEGLADSAEGELRLLDLVALALGLLAIEAEGGDLRAAEGDARDHVLVQRQRVLASHVLDGDDALVPGRVRKPVAADHVARSVNPVLGGPVKLVLQGLAIFAAALTGCVGLTAVGALLVGLIFLLLLAYGGNFNLHSVVRLLEALRVGHAARHDPDAAVLKLLPKLVRDLRVLGRQEPVQDLDDGHLGPEVPVHAGELGAHGPAPKDDNRVRVILRHYHVIAG